MEVSLGYHVTKFFSEFRSTTASVVREAEDLKNRVDRIEIGVNKNNSGVNLYSYFDDLENKINELDDKVRETHEAMAIVDLNSQFNFLTQMKEFQLQTESYIDKLDEHLQAQGHKPKTLRHEQKSTDLHSEKKVPPSATKSTLAAKLGYMTPTKFTHSDPDDPPTPTLEDFGISESTLASLDDNKSAKKAELSSVQRGLSFTETAVTGVKTSTAPSVTAAPVTSAVTAKPTESVKPLATSSVSTSVKSSTAPSVTSAPVTTNTAVTSVKPSVAPSVSTSTTTTKSIESDSTSATDHVPADFMNNANIEVREKKKKGGKKKSNNSNPDTIFPLMEMIEAGEMQNLRAILKSKISFDELNKLIEQINEFVTDKRFAGQEDAGYITKEELQSVFNTGDKTQIILLSLIDLKRLKSTSINGNTVFLILTSKTI